MNFIDKIIKRTKIYRNLKEEFLKEVSENYLNQAALKADRVTMSALRRDNQILKMQNGRLKSKIERLERTGQ